MRLICWFIGHRPVRRMELLRFDSVMYGAASTYDVCGRCGDRLDGAFH